MIDLTDYILQYNEGIFLLGQVPNKIIEDMQKDFKFKFKYGRFIKYGYYVKTEGTHTYIREW